MCRGSTVTCVLMCKSPHSRAYNVCVARIYPPGVRVPVNMELAYSGSRTPGTPIDLFPPGKGEVAQHQRWRFEEVEP